MNMVPGENISGTVCGKMDGEESTKEKKSGEIRELLLVSVWYVCLCSVEEDGSEQKEVEIEGEHFFIPVDAEKYLMTSYGANYRDKGPENYRQSAIAVCSTLIPCEEFMQQGKDLKRLASRRKRRARRQKFGLSYREYFNQCWDYVQLEIVFGRYTDMMNKCLKYDEIFEADPELLDIYIQYLEKTGRVGFMEKVKKYV